jgi:hypothetical protein
MPIPVQPSLEERGGEMNGESGGLCEEKVERRAV